MGKSQIRGSFHRGCYLHHTSDFTSFVSSDVFTFPGGPSSVHKTVKRLSGFVKTESLFFPQIANDLQLSSNIRERPWQIQACSAITKEGIKVSEGEGVRGGPSLITLLRVAVFKTL